MNRIEKQHEAWNIRESGDNVSSLAILTQLYFEYINENQLERAINVLFDVSVAWRNEGQKINNPEYFKAAIKSLEHAKSLAEQGNLELRADYDYYLGNIQLDAGKYTDAVRSYFKYLKNQIDPEQKAEIESKIGYAFAKSGHHQKGIPMIERSISYLMSRKPNMHQGKDLTVIKLTGAMLRLAEVTKDKDKKEKLINKVIEIAKNKGLEARLQESKNLLD